jgi:Mg2+/Co2+ transporter CorB
MIIVGWVVALILIAIAALLRAGGSSLMRTPRADALRDAGDGDTSGSSTVAHLLEDRSEIQPALGTTITALVVLAVILMTWALTDMFGGVQLGIALLAMTIGMLLVVDVIPRWIGRNRPRTVAYRLARPLSAAISIGAVAGDLIADPEDLEPEDEPSDAEERELIMHRYGGD